MCFQAVADISKDHQAGRVKGFSTINRRLMKSSVRWLLFEYNGLELVILSKPFKTKKLAENDRLKYPDRERQKIGIGILRA
jgi:hypothetical protein